MWLFASIAYGLVALIAWRLLTYHLAYRFALGARAYTQCPQCEWPNQAELVYRSPSGDIWFGACTLGLLLGVLWPLAAFFVAPGIPRIGDHARAHSLAQARRIKHLEREAGIGD